jgi:hypothetical protein
MANIPNSFVMEKGSISQNLIKSTYNTPFSYKNKKTISMAFSPQANYTDWATATGRLILVATFADRGVSRGQRDWFSWPLISVSWTEAATLHSSSFSFILKRLSGPPSRPTPAQKIR